MELSSAKTMFHAAPRFRQQENRQEPGFSLSPVHRHMGDPAVKEDRVSLREREPLLPDPELDPSLQHKDELFAVGGDGGAAGSRSHAQHERLKDDVAGPSGGQSLVQEAHGVLASDRGPILRPHQSVGAGTARAHPSDEIRHVHVAVSDGAFELTDDARLAFRSAPEPDPEAIAQDSYTYSGGRRLRMNPHQNTLMWPAWQGGSR